MAMSNLRFFALDLITAGFWSIQGQLYASMRTNVLRMAGETYKPEWYANVKPPVVVLLVVAITQPSALEAQNSILMPMSLVPSRHWPWPSSAFLRNIGGARPVRPPDTAMMVVHAILGLCECFLSRQVPRVRIQAGRPPGKEGIFLGFAHVYTFFAWIFGFIFSGFLLAQYCPEPTTLSPELQLQHAAALAGQGPMPEVYANAHYLWLAYAGVRVLCCSPCCSSSGRRDGSMPDHA